MSKFKTLLIMAAGMGSRYGGLKQIEKMGPNGEFILDYSIYDAKMAGFNKVVFVIKKENYEVFKETIGKRVEPYITTEYAFQDASLIPKKYYEIFKNREKPLGTAHAILSAKNNIDEPFAVINADDFYGRDAYIKAAAVLDNLKEEKAPYEYAMIGYQVKNTMTENGAVKRGVCEVTNNYLTNIIECSIEKRGSKVIATSLNENISFEISDDDIVSMNLSLFTPSFFKYIEKNFIDFLEKNKEDPENCEFFIPDVIFSSILEKYATVKVYRTDASWYGITYKEDAENVKKALKEMIASSEYPNNLWN